MDELSNLPECKIVVVGDKGVGKTSLLMRLTSYDGDGFPNYSEARPTK